MTRNWTRRSATLLVGLALGAPGCARDRAPLVDRATRVQVEPLSHSPTRADASGAPTDRPPDGLARGTSENQAMRPASSRRSARDAAPPSVAEGESPDAEEVLPLSEPAPVQLEDVLDSVLASYPLLQSAMLARNVAQGDLLAANGEFDLKLKADTLNMGLGFYQNYRQSVGAEQPLFQGGTLFGGYRLGNGNFPVYYGDRSTLQGGEFKAGMSIPLVQNRRIDDRRAGLWRNRWEVRAVEPEIQAQLIAFMQAAAVTYWNWVAAGQNVRIAEDLLRNATERTDGLRRRVEQGDAPPIELTDNQRLIVSRRTKLIDAQRKLLQSSYKLSLFLRDAAGQPRVLSEAFLPTEMPAAADPAEHDLAADIEAALINRPELRALSILREQLRIDRDSARNLALPQINAVMTGSQDAGNPARGQKNDKSPFEMEAGVIGSVPLQRRKGLGKSRAVEGKLAQVNAKTRFTRDKIVAEVQSAHAALNAAYQQLEQAHQSLELARQMELAERRKFDLGDSNLLLVNLREQATADAATVEVEARLSYFDAQADYRAALGTDGAP